LALRALDSVRISPLNGTNLNGGLGTLVWRREYFDDPTAPRPNSLVPAASGVVVDDQGRILLHRRADTGFWALPGGAMDLGESIAQTIVREVKEETGLDIEPVRLVGIYSDPRHVIAYTDGEIRQPN
jgi:8-oxo-dGTP pyrophosphatase MutT (NUDIX family)